VVLNAKTNDVQLHLFGRLMGGGIKLCVGLGFGWIFKLHLLCPKYIKRGGAGLHSPPCGSAVSSLSFILLFSKPFSRGY